MLIMAGMNRPASARRQIRGKETEKARNEAAPRLPLPEEIITRPTFRRERAALKRGVWPIAGCDEAGRGPLAGPVVAAAVILDPGNIPRGLDDSKRLTPERRAVLYERICARAQVAVALAPPARIGRDGIIASIAAASIVAKVTRDRLMACLGAAHPGYGFERHMGYSVPEHFEALDRLGPTIHHRRSFSPVAIALGELGADGDEAIADVLPL